jgi:hypothetical protein
MADSGRGQHGNGGGRVNAALPLIRLRQFRGIKAFVAFDDKSALGGAAAISRSINCSMSCASRLVQRIWAAEDDPRELPQFAQPVLFNPVGAGEQSVDKSPDPHERVARFHDHAIADPEGLGVPLDRLRGGKVSFQQQLRGPRPG